jgi:hypothetical protein
VTVPKLSGSLIRDVNGAVPPVRTLARPLFRVLAVACWIPLALLLVIALLGLRHDAKQLGDLLMWAPLVVSALLGVALVALALSEVIPGRGASRSMSRLLLALGAVALFTQAWLTKLASPGIGMEPGMAMGSKCMAAEVMFGISALAVILFLIRRAAPLRMAWAGVIAGTAAGLLAEGIYRLHCAATGLSHVLIWHAGGIVVLAVLGYAAGRAWERREGLRMLARMDQRQP